MAVEWEQVGDAGWIEPTTFPDAVRVKALDGTVRVVSVVGLDAYQRAMRVEHTLGYLNRKARSDGW